MSKATLQAIEDAITAHLADEYDEPWLVTHWYAIACASDDSMENTNYVHMAPEAPLHTSLGLIRVADNRLVALIDSDDED
jgi:hypothetical protein